MAFLGPNGAGKTSTIDMILGRSRPNAGAVQVYGMAPRQAFRKGLVAAVMQTGGLLKDLTVAETVEYTTRAFRGQPPGRRSAGPVGHHRDRGPQGREMLGRRTAAAAVHDGADSRPELLIFDEPAQGMDVEGRRGFWTAIRQDAARGRTIIFATHYLEDAPPPECL